MQALARGGTFVLVGMGAEACDCFPSMTLVAKEADVKGCFRYTNTVRHPTFDVAGNGVMWFQFWFSQQGPSCWLDSAYDALLPAPAKLAWCMHMPHASSVRPSQPDDTWTKAAWRLPDF